MLSPNTLPPPYPPPTRGRDRLSRLVVFISGEGTNLQALIDACHTHDLGGKIAAVISDNPNAMGLQRAQKAQIPTHIIERKNFSTATDFNQALLNAAENERPDLVILAGFMRILSSEFVQHFHDRLINIHPSLLPKHKGLHTHESALTAGDLQHGCSVHFVTEELDGGPVIAQAYFDVQPQHTVEQLQHQAQILEHQLLPLCVTWINHEKIAKLNHTVIQLSANELQQAWQSYEKIH